MRTTRVVLASVRILCVSNWLSMGWQPKQLTAKGYGESKPVDSNATAEGRARNRRVVMEVLENPGDVKVEQK